MTLPPRDRIARLLFWGGLAVAAIVAGVVLRSELTGTTDASHAAVNHSIRCDGAEAANFPCWKRRYETFTRELGVTAAFIDLRAQYERNPYAMSQCHQFAHVIGNTHAEIMQANVAEAFKSGDTFCWSGFYHGVIERAVQLVGRENLLAGLNDLCAKIPGKDSYSFDYYNCVHGLGHGIMAITRNELFESLALCDHLAGNWERESCFGGVFMENVMADNRNHFTKYLKTDDLVYPCNAVDEKYRYQCYLMQTSYMLARNGQDFTDVFRRCADADANFRDTCAESAGRDASGSTVSDIAGTLERCALARDNRQHEHCLIGASKDFVSYYHNDMKARDLCTSAPVKFQDSCLSTVENYYRSFR